MATLKRSHIQYGVMLLLACTTEGALAQCKYEVDAIDPISNQRTLRTQAIRVHDGLKVKNGISVGFLEVKLAREAGRNTLELHAHTKNPQARMMMFRIPNDSLTIKFTDGNIISLPNMKLPEEYMNAFNGKRMVAFTYILPEEVMVKFRSGGSVDVLRITMSDQKWDFIDFKTDPAQLVRDCLPVE
jgi:hypothetical protein